VTGHADRGSAAVTGLAATSVDSQTGRMGAPFGLPEVRLELSGRHRPHLTAGRLVGPAGARVTHEIVAEDAPAGPLPFSAPLTLGLVPTVLIGGRPAAVVGASGYNTPPHTAPLSDPFVAPMLQVGRVLSGSATVLIGGKPAATAQSSCTCCATPGQLTPTVSTVLIG